MVGVAILNDKRFREHNGVAQLFDQVRIDVLPPICIRLLVVEQLITKSIANILREISSLRLRPQKPLVDGNRTVEVTIDIAVTESQI